MSNGLLDKRIGEPDNHPKSQQFISRATTGKENSMARVLVLYYSTYGHIETMAGAITEGARSVGAEVTIKRVPELVPDEIARKAGYKLDQPAPVASVNELPEYDAIIFGTPTRYGNMAAQMKNFIDQTGSLWVQGKLVGKVGSVFTSSGSQHGGQETTIFTFLPPLLHLGFVIVGLPYSFQGQMGVAEVMGNSPYGAFDDRWRRRKSTSIADRA